MTQASMTPAMWRFIIEMQRIRYGRIEGLLVRQGSPVLEPPPCIFREIRLGGDGIRTRINVEAIAQRAQVRDMVSHMDSIGDGRIDCIEIRDGLPFRMTIKEKAA